MPRTPKRTVNLATDRVRQTRKRADGFSRAKNAAIASRVPQLGAPPPVLGKTILVVDPGGSTGIAVRYPDGTWMTTTVTTPSELWDFFLAGPDEVVFEVFSTGGRVDHYMIYTIELVGGMKAVLYALGLHGFAHSPGRRYPFMELAERMLRGQGHTVHEVDALAHLLAHENRPPSKD